MKKKYIRPEVSSDGIETLEMVAATTDNWNTGGSSAPGGGGSDGPPSSGGMGSKEFGEWDFDIWNSDETLDPWE